MPQSLARRVDFLGVGHDDTGKGDITDFLSFLSPNISDVPFIISDVPVIAPFLTKLRRDDVAEAVEQVFAADVVGHFPDGGRNHQRPQVGTISRFVGADEICHARQPSTCQAWLQAGGLMSDSDEKQVR